MRLKIIVRIAFSRSSTFSRKLLTLTFISRHRSWHNVLLPKFILRNLKKNCSVYLIYIKFNFIKYLLIYWLQYLIASINIKKNHLKLRPFINILYFVSFRRFIFWLYHPTTIVLYEVSSYIVYLNPILTAIRFTFLRTV